MKLLTTLTIAALTLILAVPSAFATYSDLSTDNENLEGIYYLEELGATDNADNFRPEDKINRAEMFKIIFSIFGEVKSHIDKEFIDVSSDAWFKNYAELAYEYDLIDKSDYFNPELNLSRADVLEVLLKAYGFTTPIIAIEARSNLYRDVLPEHPQYSVIKKAADEGLINPDENKLFKPYERITRGEFAQIIFEFDQFNTDVYFASEDNETYKSDIYEDVWNRIIDNYYLEEGQYIDEEILFQNSIKEMVQSLDDPFSVFFSAEEATNFTDSLSGDYEGIGTYLNINLDTNEVEISGFISDSPAEEVGVEIGDIITHINGVSAYGMTIEEIVSRVKGPTGTSVELTISRDGISHTFTIERKEIVFNFVSGEIYDNDIWYIDIQSFGSDVDWQTEDLIENLRNQETNPKAIIVDLRSNGGGYVNPAISIASFFIPQGAPIMQIDYNDFGYTSENSEEPITPDAPVYVLVDQYSASASEILAAALSEQIDATLVGTQTYGKGSAQQLITYWDGSILKLTVAHWLTSEGNSIHQVGLTPDLLITETSETEDLWLEEVLDDLGR